jgi:hypothetical protein
MINALNLKWPDTGRRCPEGAKLEIRHVHAKWQDLAWWSEKQDAWIYISTLPAPAKPVDPPLFSRYTYKEYQQLMCGYFHKYV